MELTPTEIWELSARALHRKEYTEKYVGLLAKEIGEKDKSILDTACGTGFPSLFLLESGFKDITFLDADNSELDILRSRLGSSKRVINARWQDLEKHVKEKFDVVLNIDSAIGYMDSWSGPPEAKGKEVIIRITHVIKKFYDVLNRNGRLIIAFPKNNLRSNTSKIDIDLGNVDYYGNKARILWEIKFNWENRIKFARMKIVVGKEEFSRLVMSYLFTKEDMEDILVKCGFKKIKHLNSEGLYDTILVAYK